MGQIVATLITLALWLLPAFALFVWNASNNIYYEGRAGCKGSELFPGISNVPEAFCCIFLALLWPITTVWGLYIIGDELLRRFCKWYVSKPRPE